MCLALPGKVIRVEGNWASVDLGGFVEEVNVAGVPGVRPGQHVLVHAGYAVEKLSVKRAGEIFAELEALLGGGESQ